MDVGDAESAYVQIYSLDVVSPIDPDSDECVKIWSLTTDRAYNIVKTMLNHKVIPLLLTLHHADGYGHFKAVRFDPSYYRSWSVVDDSRETMRDRMCVALVKLGVPLMRSYLPEAVASQVTLTPSVSLFSDSQSQRSETSNIATTTAPAVTPVARELSQDSAFDETETARMHDRVRARTVSRTRFATT